MTARTPVVSVTAADCRWEYYRGTGAGGQHRNKTSSAVRCTHEPSGAVGQAQDTRSQHENRRLAFRRMAESAEMQRWLRLETARRVHGANVIEDAVSRQSTPDKLRVERIDAGKWSAWDESEEVGK